MTNRPIKFRAWWTTEKQMARDVHKCDALQAYIDHGDFVLSQFTGQVDRDGREIYEGDVVYIDKDVNGLFGYNVLVVFRKFGFRFQVIVPNQNRESDDGYDRDIAGFPPSMMKVQGNSFENPELLQ